MAATKRTKLEDLPLRFVELDKDGKPTGKPAAKTVTIMNQGIRTFHTDGGGVLKPGASIMVSEAEAKELLEYPELRDLAKIAPKTQETMNKLKADNDRLQKELDAVKGVSKEEKKTDGKK